MSKKNKRREWVKPNRFCYLLTKIAALAVAKLLFKRKFLRNEIKHKKGPFVVIANHQAALDFVNLIGATRRPMSFVISNSFYQTLPVKGVMDKIGVIPKQQFQTTVHDIKRMKAVIDAGGILVIYPAGLMCEDGRSTPIPTATYQFLKWIRADIYIARTSGAYFVTPKWRKKARPGRTYLDIYRLFTKEELADMPTDDVKQKTDEAILFDAYREQERLLVKYKGGDHLEGLEHVLYRCPHCMTEHSIAVENRSTILCRACGFREESDEYGFLHLVGEVGQQVRYVSDWSRIIYDKMKAEIKEGKHQALTADATVRMIDPRKKKYRDVGRARVTLTSEHFLIEGCLRGKEVSLTVPIDPFASLPFRPGVFFEIQNGDDIYRCVPDDGRLVMKFVNAVKIHYEMKQAAKEQKALRGASASQE